MADHEAKGHDAHGGGGGDAHPKHKKHHPAHAPHEEHEEGWIVSFADNVLLQMGFFVILLALNMGPKGGGEGEGESGGETASQTRLIDLAIEVRSAFNSPVNINSNNPNDAPLIRRLLERRGKTHDGTVGKTGESDQPQMVRPTEFSGVGAAVEFDDRSPKLTDAARETLRQLVGELEGSRWMIEIRGHASAAESGREPKASRALAYERAYAAGEELVALGLDWRQIRLVSAGEVDPVVPRARAGGEQRTNQRAEIVKLEETVPPDEFGEGGG